jgi:hypothetical protein
MEADKILKTVFKNEGILRFLHHINHYYSFSSNTEIQTYLTSSLSFWHVHLL